MEFLLRQLEKSDSKSIKKYANNKNIGKNLRDTFPYPYTIKAAAEYISTTLEKEGKGQLCRAICVEDEVIGVIGVFQGQDIYRKSAEVGYWIGEPFWGQKITSRAIQQICCLAFEQMDIVRIYAEPFARNIPSRRCLEKAGFVLEGVAKSGAFKDGKIIDYCMYALVRQ